MTEDRVPTSLRRWIENPRLCPDPSVHKQPAPPLDLDRALTASGFPSAVEQPAPPLDTLSNALHAIGGEFCSPFTDAHPAGMHNSQAAAILSLTEQPAPPLDVERLREHEPEPGMGNYATWRWDCSCGWYDNDSDAQKWWTHVLGSEAP